ncbi:non-specific protein-tyrosine kinase [Geodermatophilus normandii]|uniref:Non-specific protein-tyrosine kinase n=1 Tax=Geodermatophilus normandii TaxID=1137989 RepID=A0A317QGW9_9ACTN|nr:CpsD/CapB family tyrosine-protein kinase [Geodermatophilus normandii]PWW21886.1 non-specific protein-tyrosine kinase [Geodermatophilus normandii]
MRRLRATLFLAGTGEAPALVAVTASEPGEGVSTLVTGLAGVLAPGSRVAVVEADLRDPVLARRLGLDETAGLGEVLEGRADLAEALTTWGDGVTVLPAGTATRDPGDLLATARVGEVLDRLRATHDVVLVDTPPLGSSVDAALLARRCDGAVVLCRAGATAREEVAATVSELTAVGARVIGGVLTMVPARRRRRRSAARGATGSVRTAVAAPEEEPVGLPDEEAAPAGAHRA